MEHNTISHATVYQPNTHVPLIIHFPNISPTTIQDNVQEVDIVPTILDIVGIKSSHSYDGRSVLPLILGKTLSPKSTITQGYGLVSTSIRYNQWEVVAAQGSNNHQIASEMYDIIRDPDETTNILIAT